jgi:hypothetical protein
VTVRTVVERLPDVPGSDRVVPEDATVGTPGTGTVTVTTEPGLPEALGRVTVRTVLELPRFPGAVTVAAADGDPGTTGIVKVAPEPGMPEMSGTVTVRTETAELLSPPGNVTVAPDPASPVEGRGSVTVRTGTVTVLFGVGNSVTVTVSSVPPADGPWLTERVSEVEQDVESEPDALGSMDEPPEPEDKAREPEGEPPSPGPRVTVKTVTGPRLPVGVG